MEKREMTAEDLYKNLKLSPDGKSIVFTSNRSGKFQIYLLSAEGGEAIQITHCSHGANNPIWSPDARKFYLKPL